jgi:hypothetical protein
MPPPDGTAGVTAAMASALDGIRVFDAVAGNGQVTAPPAANVGGS